MTVKKCSTQFKLEKLFPILKDYLVKSKKDFLWIKNVRDLWSQIGIHFINIWRSEMQKNKERESGG
jgi:hypothetical protein